MNAVEFIRMALDTSARATLSLIKDMKDHCFTFPTPKGGNHPLWVLGHLAWSEGDIIQAAMLGKTNPLAHWKGLFGIGSEPSADASQYPPFDEIKKAFLDLRGKTLKALESMTDADLDRPSLGCPSEFTNLLGTNGQCFMIAILNTMNHRGQVADARRAAGRTPLTL